MAKTRSLAWLGCAVPGIILLPLLLFLAIWQFLSPARPPITMVAFSEFMAQVRADRDHEPYVEAVDIHGQEIEFWIKDPKSQTKAKRGTVGPADTRDLVKELEDRHVAVVFEAPDPPGSALNAGLFLFAAVGFVVGGIGLVLMMMARAELSRTRERLAYAEAEIARLTAEQAA